MEIKFWGTRGSTPRCMSDASALDLLERLVGNAKKQKITDLDAFLAAAKEKKLGNPLVFGGNTPCTEIIHEGKSYFVDMGTGLREAGTFYLGKQKEFIFFLTHLHWDHIMGLLFFIPIFIPGHKIVIHHIHGNAPAQVKILFNGMNFPIKWEALSANIEFRELKIYQATQFGDLTVTPFVLDHPGGCFGYRFDGGGKSVSIGVDGEYTRISRQDLGADLKYYQNLDYLVFDAQYDLNELVNKFDWGHCSPLLGIDLALREGIRNLVFLHHDPWASEEKLLSTMRKSQKYLANNIASFQSVWDPLEQNGPNLILSYDGLTLQV